MDNSKKKHKYQKSDKNTLTDLTTAANLKIALRSPQADQCYFKQTKGGNVEFNQPPNRDSGFFVPATYFGDVTILPSVATNKIPFQGNTRSVPFWTLEGTRHLFSCQYFKNTKGLTAMINANTHGTATPVATEQGASSNLSNDCLLHSSVLSDALQKAKTDAAKGGKFGTANAYADLLKAFHSAILPAFISETGGNISAIARLLGIHRESVTHYAEGVGLTHLIGRNGQAFGKTSGGVK